MTNIARRIRVFRHSPAIPGAGNPVGGMQPNASATKQAVDGHSRKDAEMDTDEGSHVVG
jgi:hypothetical protein